MSVVPSPCETATADFEPFIRVLGCAIAPRSAIYASVPLTTGRSFLEWFRQRDQGLQVGSAQYAEAHHRRVFHPNSLRAAEIVSRLRTAVDPRPVIDPSSFDPGDWTQSDFRCFWGKVIERFVAEVVFSDGWEFSNGCAYEFLIAWRHRIPTCDASRQPITSIQAARMIDLAAEALQRHGLDHEFLSSIAKQLVEGQL
jgi:hypothetical protein